MRLSRSSAGETVLVAACRYSSAPDPGEVLTDLFVVHSRALVGLARLLVDDQATAEDVVQDAFVATFSRWSNIRDPEAALPYLRSAVINHARKSLRSRQHGGRVSLPQPGEPEYPGPGTEAVERGHVVLTALRTLPYRQRQVVVLRYYLDLSEGQIADQLGVTRGSVHRQLARAAGTLRTELDELKDQR